MNVQARIVRVPEDEGELNTAAPVFGDRVGVEAMLEVNGALVNVVSVREEQDAPIQ